MRYFLAILGVILLVVATIFIIAKSTNHKPLTPPPNVTKYSNSDSSVTQVVTGVLTSENDRRAIQITVNQSSRSLYILSGYENTISNSETFPNTPAAYESFLQGLQNAGFTANRVTTQTNMFAVCPLEDTFQYQLNTTQKSVSNLWSTSCFNSDGNFAGKGPLVRTLFQLQIPNFITFTQGLPSIPNFYTTLPIY